jgi:hypothetical protein
MEDIINSFADGLVAINQTCPAYRNFFPGIGSYSENRIVQLAVNHLHAAGLIHNFHLNPNTNTRRKLGLIEYTGLNNERAIPDLVVDNHIVEFKICRPIRNDGKREDTWFKKVFEPYYGAKSALSDVMKLCKYRDNHDPSRKWKYWVVIIGFERQNETEYNLDILFPDLFRHLSEQILELPFQDYLSVSRDLGTRHPYHQVLKLYAFGY